MKIRAAPSPLWGQDLGADLRVARGEIRKAVILLRQLRFTALDIGQRHGAPTLKISAHNYAPGGHDMRGHEVRHPATLSHLNFCSLARA